jgi:hypothetical protein
VGGWVREDEDEKMLSHIIEEEKNEMKRVQRAPFCK